MRFINYIRKAVFGENETRRAGTLQRHYLQDRNRPRVTEDNALEISDILTCVRVLAESIASLPLCVYIEGNNGGQKATEHPLYELLRWQPNANMTSYDLRLWMMIDCLVRGNGVAQVLRDNTGKVVELYPLFCSKLNYHIMEDGTLHYTYPDPENPEEEIMLEQNEVLHIRLFASGNLLSPSLIEMGEELLTGALGAENYTREFFENGTAVSGVIEYPTEMDEETFERLKTDWSAKYSGNGSRHKTPILEGGAKFTPIALSHQETQMLESRKYTRSQIAGLFRVPAHLINDLDKATFSNIVEQDLGFVKHTLRPYLTNWEQKLRMTLLNDTEKQIYYFKHETDDLLRGDLKSRMEAYAQGIQNGIFSPNDARRREDEPTYEGGDTYFVNGALMPVEVQSQPQEAVAKVQEDVVNKTYNDYPQSATNNAKRALKWVEKNGWGSCGTDVGKQRARQLASRESLSRDTIARMASFKRHQQHKDVPYGEGCGGLMWDCWGGTSGIEWAIRKLKEIDKKK
tara:strand:- start:20477 stop:22021 length:1545 start_codon:yes stop_codon:yes gene_type:complete